MPPARQTSSASTTLATTAALCLCLTPPAAAQPETPATYAITTNAAVAALPEPIRPFFESHRKTLQDRAAAVIASPARTTTRPRNVRRPHIGKARTNDLEAPANHYFLLDAAVGPSDPHISRKLRHIPTNESEATEWCAQHGHTNCGRLPWALAACYRDLADAFRRPDPTAVLDHAACVIHLATDAALPFHTSVRSWTTTNDENPADEDHRPTRARAQPAPPWHLYHVSLPNRLRERLEYEVRVYPQRYSACTDPIPATLTAMAAANAALPSLDGSTRDTARPRTSHAAEGLSGYLHALADQAAPILEDRLEAGALLAANLIGGAWSDAGQPILRPAGASRTPPPATTAETPPSNFVASQNSAVFHRPTCIHVRRIKPENVIQFADEDAARASGRGPCKICKPDQP